MGVQGLLTFLKNNQENCIEYVDLVEVARQGGGIELLVDYYCFQHLIVDGIWKSLAEVQPNSFLRLAGGEYQTLDQYASKLVNDLKAVGITLVFFVDGSKGSSTYQTQQKLDTWKSRHKNEITKLKQLIDVCNGEISLSALRSDVNVRPVLLEVQLFETLRACGCEVHQLSFGEADYALARALVNRPKAYAILSNDTDFCVFRDSVLIHVDVFDMEKDLGLGEPYSLRKKPLRLVAGKITQAGVSRLLGFKGPCEHRLLVEFSIICGNDFTGPVIRRGHIKDKLGLNDPNDLREIADWILDNQMVDAHPMIKQEIKRNKQLMDAIEYSREFYCLLYTEPGISFKGPMSRHIDEGIRQGIYPAHLMGMHNNFYWHRMLLEDCRNGHPCIEWQLADLRRYVYRMVLPRDDRVVTEYGRARYEEIQTSQIMVADEMLLTVDRIHKEKFSQNLKTFHRIILHQERNFGREFFNYYGLKMGFTVYVLRYFLVLNRGKNLNITDTEFIDLVAVAFSQGVDVNFYQRLALRPSVRCVTMGNWFQDVYRHAYSYLGKILQISHEFPQPKEIFNGSVWTAFYMSGTDFTTRGPVDLSKGDMGRIYHEKQNIIREKSRMIPYIVEGYMDFNRQ